MLFVSLALVAAGIGLGVLIYRRAGLTDPLQQAQPALFRFLENKMWIDELYAHTVIAFSKTRRARLELAGSIFLGRIGPRRRRDRSDYSAVFPPEFDERGINAASMKASAARAASAG